MKRLALASAASFIALGFAQAVDLPSRRNAPSPPPPPPAFLFEGFYAGAQIGALGTGDRSERFFAPTDARLAVTTTHGGSVIGGVHAGYDWHEGPIVFGLLGDVSGARAVSSGVDVFGIDIKNTVDVQGSLRGRVGYAFDRLLLYATGGLNVAHVTHDQRSLLFSERTDLVVAEPTVGVGAEYAFDDRWRGHVELRNSDLETRKEASLVLPGTLTRHKAGEGEVSLGVSYRFGQ